MVRTVHTDKRKSKTPKHRQRKSGTPAPAGIQRFVREEVSTPESTPSGHGSQRQIPLSPNRSRRTPGM